jgi:hypothetical protein
MNVYAEKKKKKSRASTLQTKKINVHFKVRVAHKNGKNDIREIRTHASEETRKFVKVLALTWRLRPLGQDTGR